MRLQLWSLNLAGRFATLVSVKRFPTCSLGRAPALTPSDSKISTGTRGQFQVQRSNCQTSHTFAFSAESSARSGSWRLALTECIDGSCVRANIKLVCDSNDFECEETAVRIGCGKEISNLFLDFLELEP